jgi:hypothetical protein
MGKPTGSNASTAPHAYSAVTPDRKSYIVVLVGFAIFELAIVVM